MPYVPPHLRNKGGGANGGGGGGAGRSLADLDRSSRPPQQTGGGDLRGPAAELLSKQEQNGRQGAAAVAEGDQRPDFSKMFPKRQGRDWSAQGAAKYGTPPEASLRAEGDGGAAEDAVEAREQRAERLDASGSGGGGGRGGGGGGGRGGGRGGRDRPAPTYEDGRYVSAYSSEQSQFLASDDSAKISAKGDAALDDYAKMVEFSRHRREQLKASGQERRSGGRGGRNGKGKQSAPRAFGTNDHGPGMRPDEDLPGGERVDGEGMVYSLDSGTRTVYFCDRFRRYKFVGKAGGLALLQAMCTKNDICLGFNAKLFSTDPGEAAQQRAEGYALYEEKPNLRRRDRKQIGTWSDEEYGLAGFQWMYLRLKSFQRFTETWALLERCAAAGLFAPRSQGGIFAPTTAEDIAKGERPLRVCSLGGGPGYELLAYDWFARYWSQVGASGTPEEKEAWLVRMHSCLNGNEPSGNGTNEDPGIVFASLDLQPSWKLYVDTFGYEFAQWDMHKSGPPAILGPNVPPKPVMVMGTFQPPWDILNDEARAAAIALGWGTKEMWEREAMPAITEKLWGEMTEDEIRHATTLGFTGPIWDGEQEQTSEQILELAGMCGGCDTVCMLSNIMCYCTDDATADFFTALLSPGGGVRAIIANERGAEQGICRMLEQRGVTVVYLLDQVAAGKDHRQLMFLPPGSPASHPSIPLPDDFHNIFPNQPYEEKKKQPLSAEEQALRAPRSR